MVEDALYEAAPDVGQLLIEGLEEPQVHTVSFPSANWADDCRFRFRLWALIE